MLPIQHALLGSGPLSKVTEVLSHPQALAQCSGWLAQHLPDALQLPTSSTAEAARMVAGSPFRAAIASQTAAREHGLDQLAFPVNDVAGNRTRFLLLQPWMRWAVARRRADAGPTSHCTGPGPAGGRALR